MCYRNNLQVRNCQYVYPEQGRRYQRMLLWRQLCSDLAQGHGSESNHDLSGHQQTQVHGRGAWTHQPSKNQEGPPRVTTPSEVSHLPDVSWRKAFCSRAMWMCITWFTSALSCITTATFTSRDSDRAPACSDSWRGRGQRREASRGDAPQDEEEDGTRSVSD